MTGGAASAAAEPVLSLKDPSLERTFRGHKGAITSVSFNPNMKQLVSGSKDGCLMVWNFRPQLRAFRFVGHKVGVVCVARLVCMYNAFVHAVAFCVAALPLMAWERVTRFVCLFCGVHARGAGCGEPCAIFAPWRCDCVWLNGSHCATVDTHCVRANVLCLCLAVHGPCTTSGGASCDGVLTRLRLPCVLSVPMLVHGNSKGKSNVLKGHSGAVRSVCFSADSRFLLTASDDKTMKLWSLPTRKFQCSLSGHSNWVRSGVLSPDTRLALSGSDDKTVKLWDLTKRRATATYYDHEGCVVACLCAFVFWLVAWWTGCLVGCLAGCLVGWLTVTSAMLSSPHSFHHYHHHHHHHQNRKLRSLPPRRHHCRCLLRRQVRQAVGHPLRHAVAPLRRPHRQRERHLLPSHRQLHAVRVL